MILPPVPEPNQSQTKSSDAPTNRKKRLAFLGLFLVAIVVIISLLIIGFPEKIRQYRLQRANQEAAKQRQLSYEKAQTTITEVETLIELPDEEPTVATISDLSKLEGQPFFAQAEEGDQVLFFTQAQKAILYRPTAHKIIEVAALQLEN